MPSLNNIRLFRDDLVLTQQYEMRGTTSSGLIALHSDSLPCIYADVILVPDNNSIRRIEQTTPTRVCPVTPGDFIVFPRYAGEAVDLDEGRFYFLHIDDIECVIPYVHDDADFAREFEVAYVG